LPTSLFAFILFVCFVTPGFVFEMRRERHRPPRSYSALRETSLVVISSVFFSLPAILVMGVLQATHVPGFPDLRSLAEQPSKYSAEHIPEVVLLILSTVAFAVLIAVICDAGLQFKHHAPVVTREPVWFELLSGRAKPKDAKAVIVTVELTSGAAVLGAVKAHGLTEDSELDWLVLGAHPKFHLQSRSPNGAWRDVGEDWRYYVISASEIRAVTVAYLDTPAA
jgi:hypothetical protein